MGITKDRCRASKARRCIANSGKAISCLIFLCLSFGILFALSEQHSATGTSVALPNAATPAPAAQTGAADTTQKGNQPSDNANVPSVDHENEASESNSRDGQESLPDAEVSSSSEDGLDTPFASHPSAIPSVAEIPQESVSEIVVEHTPDTVLVELNPEIPADVVSDALTKADGVSATTITEQDVALGFVELEVAEGVKPEQALAQLDHVDVLVDAQPNFIYHLIDTQETSAELEDFDQGEDAAAQESSSTVSDAHGATGASDTADTSGNTAPSDATDTSDTTGEPQAGLTLNAPEPTQELDLGTSAAFVDDTLAASQWMLNSVSAPTAWASVKTNKAVTVAVIDDGCKTNHEDLADNIVATYNAVTNSSSISEGRGHGTHVAGIVAAKADNGVGVAGVSYNAGLLPIQVFDNGVASSYALVRAYRYITDNAARYNIKVVNMSLGATVADIENRSQASLDYFDQLLVNSVNQAYKAGILTVCAAGNDANSMGGAYFNYPSDWLDNALGVIAVQNGSTAKRASYSNYNMDGQTTKNIAAPGSTILSTHTANSSRWGGYYANLSGTSMASPCVAGIAALVFAANPSLGPGDVADTLCRTAVDLGQAGWDAEYGSGLVNAANAVHYALKGTLPQKTSSVTATPVSSATTNATTSAPAATKTISLKTASLGSVTPQWYTGKAITPTPTVKVGSAVLRAGTDFTYAYKNNTSAGTATITVTGKGAYTGTRSITFKIVKRPTWSGATKIPAKAAAPYKVSNGSIKIISGSAVVRVSGKTVTGKKAGSAVIGLYDALGRLYTTRSVKVYSLSGSYAIRSAASSRVSISFKGVPKTNGTGAVMARQSAAYSQRYQFKVLKDGTYAIRCAGTSKYLTVKGASSASGARIVAWEWSNTTNQRWRISVDASNRLVFTSAKSGKVLSISGGRAIAGKKVVQAKATSATTRKWTLS